MSVETIVRIFSRVALVKVVFSSMEKYLAQISCSKHGKRQNQMELQQSSGEVSRMRSTIGVETLFVSIVA